MLANPADIGFGLIIVLSLLAKPKGLLPEKLTVAGLTDVAPHEVKTTNTQMEEHKTS